MARQIIVEILGDESKLDKSLTAATASSSKFGNVLKGIGQGIGQSGFGLVQDAVSKVTDFIGGSIDAASNLNETLSKSGVVFGQYAGEVETWGNTAATALGMSKQAAIEAAATLGNLFEGAGVAQKAAAGLSESTVQLAADLASFNNLDPSDVLEKLRSGLVGEAEPLRSLGVNLTAAATEAKATEMGFTKVNGVFTEGQKIQARYALIVAGTTTAQGDFARTADGLANTQRTLNAEIEDAQAKIGSALLPVVATLARVVAHDVIPAIERFFDDLGRLNDTLHLTDTILPAVGKAWQGLTAPLRAAGDALFEIDYGYRKATGGVVTSMDETRNAAIQAGMTLEDYSAAVRKALIDESGQASEKLQHLTKAADDVIVPFTGAGKALDDLRPRVVSATNALDANTYAMYLAAVQADKAKPVVRSFFDQYSIAVSKGDIAQDTLDIMANAKAVADAQKTVDKATPGTAAYRKAQLELTVAEGQLAAAHEKLTTDQITLFNTKPDSKTAKALDKYFDGLGLSVRDLTGDARKAYLAVNALLHPFKGENSVSVTFTLKTGKGGPQKLASGGPMSAGETAIVGDGGEPELFTAGASGYVTPMSRAFGGGGRGGQVVNINIGGGAFIDGPSVDRLVTELTRRMRYATGL